MSAATDQLVQRQAIDQADNIKQRLFAREPVDLADPRNVMLDLFERSVSAVVDVGAAPQARTIFDKLIPPPPAPEPEPPIPLPEPLEALALTKVLAVCRRARSWRLTAEEHESMKVLTDWLVSEINRQNALAREQLDLPDLAQARGSLLPDLPQAQSERPSCTAAPLASPDGRPDAACGRSGNKGHST